MNYSQVVSIFILFSKLVQKLNFQPLCKITKVCMNKVSQYQ